MKSTNGAYVHYVISVGGVKQCRPAFIVRAWDEPSGSSNLVVFMDGTNDSGCAHEDLCRWKTSRNHDGSNSPQADTWHTPDECPALRTQGPTTQNAG